MSFEAQDRIPEAVKNLRSDLDADEALMAALTRFMAKAKKSSETECWNWSASLTHDGYGRFTYKGKQHLAHRFSHEVFVGEVSADIKVCHTCDNPACCNPKHLFLGTNADNLRDMANKGRSTHGEKNPNRKLSKDQVIAIVADTRKHRLIAEDYGVTRSQISYIKRGESWTRLQGEKA
jgi:hypothetical protein